MSEIHRKNGDGWRFIGRIFGIILLFSILFLTMVPADAVSAKDQNVEINSTDVVSIQDQAPLKVKEKPEFTFNPSKLKKVTQEDREKAAKITKDAYEAAITQMAVMEPGGIPHYFGPYPNWANSPMPNGPIASIAVDAGGSGYTAPVISVIDVYETNTSPVDATATVSAGVITLITVNNGGAHFTAPRVIIEDATGTGAAATAYLDTTQLTGGIHKFVDSLPGLTASNANNLGQYIPVAIPDTTTFQPGGSGYTSVPTVLIQDATGSGANATAVMTGGVVTGVIINNGGTGYSDRPVISFEGGGATVPAIGKATVVGGAITAIQTIGSHYYEIELGEFTEKLHSDLPPTTLRGYRQVNTVDPTVSAFRYLGPMIVAERDIPVRIRFINKLPTEAGGDLFIPVDTTVMGAGHGDLGGAELIPQNRGTLHLHGGYTPWISDGTPFQWTTPDGEITNYPRGVSVYNVPDMADPGPNPAQGVLTFYYTNQQSARLMFYHDHSHGITRLNVYAGEAAPYLVSDQVERDLMEGTDITGVNPDGLKVLPGIGIPIVIQDKTFVDPATIAAQDPTWNWGTTPGTPTAGDLWYPHVYVPAQNAYSIDGLNPFGRWHYGPWFWPPTKVNNGPVANPYYDGINPLEPPMMPGTPNPSMAMEAFMDTSVVNGAVYPYLEVEPKAYRFRILNAADDRFVNLQLYKANTSDYLANGYPTEVAMVPAAANATYPIDWPTDGRAGGVPDPATMGPSFIMVGSEGGFLPAPVEVPNQPITWNMDPTTFNFGNVDLHSLLIAPAERADVIVDFSQYNGDTLILYNDAPAAFPALDPRADYYTGHPDLTDTGGTPPTQAGYGPNTRTVMQIRVTKPLTTPTDDVTLANLTATFAKTATKPGVFEVSQDDIISTQAEYNSAYNGNFVKDNFVRISDKTYTFNTLAGDRITMPLTSKAIQDEMGEAFDDYGRMSGFLGLQVETKPGKQQLLLYGYESPPTDLLSDSVLGTKIGEIGDGTQIWKITHNGVDTHPVHWHLVNIQLINRVGWDNAIRPPDPTELGWKETLRVSPLEDTIVAIRPAKPNLPWELPNSYRPIDPTEAIGNLVTGAPGAQLQFMDPSGEPVTVTNKEINYGWEYVFHCHILAHEEMDMMHAMLFAVKPKAPTGLTVTALGGNKGVRLNWTDNSVSETNFTIQRAPDVAFNTGVVNFTVGPNVVTYTDPTATKGTYYFRVIANNVVGDTTVYPAPAIGFPHVSADSAPSNIAAAGAPLSPPAAPSNVVAASRLQGGNARVTITWTDNSNNEAGFRIQRATNSAFTSGVVTSTVGANVATFNTGNLPHGTDFYFRVQAYNTAGPSVYVNAAPFPVRTP